MVINSIFNFSMQDTKETEGKKTAKNKTFRKKSKDTTLPHPPPLWHFHCLPVHHKKWLPVVPQHFFLGPVESILFGPSLGEG